MHDQQLICRSLRQLPPDCSYLSDPMSSQHSNQSLLGNACSEMRKSAQVSRRAVLQAGTIGGLSLPMWMTQSTAARGGSALPGFGRAKRCIFLFMWGGPSHIDTLDPKPQAPAEVRGEFAAIDTNVPGIQLSEHFKMTAQQCDKLAVIRSLTHSDPSHLASGHCTLTGQIAPVPNSDAEPPSDRDTPHIGSVISKLRGPVALTCFMRAKRARTLLSGKVSLLKEATTCSAVSAVPS